MFSKKIIYAQRPWSADFKSTLVSGHKVMTVYDAAGKEQMYQVKIKKINGCPLWSMGIENMIMNENFSLMKDLIPFLSDSFMENKIKDNYNARCSALE